MHQGSGFEGVAGPLTDRISAGNALEIRIHQRKQLFECSRLPSFDSGMQGHYKTPVPCVARRGCADAPANDSSRPGCPWTIAMSRVCYKRGIVL
jgi:hypothetical protein